MGYDRGDSFPCDFEPNGIRFGSKSKGKLSPRSYPIQCEWKYSFISETAPATRVSRDSIGTLGHFIVPAFQNSHKNKHLFLLFFECYPNISFRKSIHYQIRNFASSFHVTSNDQKVFLCVLAKLNIRLRWHQIETT